MIKWASKPDPVFNDIISNALGYYNDCIKENFFVDGSIKIFGQIGLTIEVVKIINAHNSKSTFVVTDYHFLILYEALALYCDLFNDDMFGRVSFGDIRPTKLNLDEIADIYFWDTDFLMDQAIVNGLSIDQKDNLAISPVVFSIANNLTPHADELKISVTDEELEPLNETIYVEGEPYPYLDDFDDE